MANLLVEAYRSLGSSLNKAAGRTDPENKQGVVSEKLPELSLDMKNEDLLEATKKFEKQWTSSDVYADWVKKGDENENYWKGKHFQRPETDKTRADVDNVIFEALETALPQFINRNPDPEVDLYPGMPIGSVDEEYTKTLQQDLGELADDLHLRLKLKKVARHWAIYLVGVAKAGWDVNKNIPTLKVIRPRKVILDPNATIDEDGYTGEYIGEYRKMTASMILAVPGLEPEAEKVIKDLVKDDLATEVAFIEWWTNKYFCWTLDGKTVLLKKKNPHWNYDEQVPMPAIDDVMTANDGQIGTVQPGMPAVPQLPTTSENAAPIPAMPTPAMPQAPAAPAAAPIEGEAPTQAPEVAGEIPTPPKPEPQMQTIEGVNHFSAPHMPYIFLSMFNLGKQPVDETSLITQNLSGQDRINKRNKQIDKNADNMNNGLVVSLERSGLTTQQAKGVSEALRKGGVVGIPAGSAQDAVYKPPTPGLPADIFNNLVDLRARVRGIFGVQGSSAAGLQTETTVRGKIMNRTLDTDRIGGGISEYLEQFADEAYNWFVQLMMVYDKKYSELAAQGQVPKVRVSIKEGSLLPKDATTMANQAIELATSGKMSTLDLYKQLQYPNPEELAANAWLETNAPDLLYANEPRVAQALQRIQQQQQAEAQAKASASQPAAKPPSESINFKDLPPDGQTQMAAKAGITLHAEGIAAHKQLSNARSSVPGNSNAELNAGVAPTVPAQ